MGTFFGTGLIRKIVKLVRQRGWSPICKEYADALRFNFYAREFMNEIHHCEEIISKDIERSFVTVFEFSQPDFIKEIFCKDNVFKFQIPGSIYNDLEFVLSTTAAKEDNPYSFSIRWGFFQKLYEYSYAMIPKLHFAFVVSENNNSWERILPVNLCGKPKLDKFNNTDWTWGSVRLLKYQREHRFSELGDEMSDDDHDVNRNYVYIFEDEKIKLVAFAVL